MIRHYSASLFLVLSVGSLCVSATKFPFESTFRFVLISAILFIVRRARLVLALELALGAAMFLATWAGAADWYSAVPGLDVLAHTVVPAVATIAFCWYLTIRERGSRPAGNTIKNIRLVLAAGFVMFAAMAWEFYEWFVVIIFAGRTIHTDVADTAKDIAVTAIGCLAGSMYSRKSFGDRSRET